MKSPPDLSHKISTAFTEDEDDSDLEAARSRDPSKTTKDHAKTSFECIPWVDTLRPENSEAILDKNFFLPETPWWRIQKDTTDVPESPSTRSSDGSTITKVTVPSEQALPCPANSSKSPPASETSDEEDDSGCTRPHFCQVCNCIGLLFGFVVALPALVIVLVLEVVAWLACYLPSLIFYHAARAVSPPDCCTCLFHLVFKLSYLVLSFLDSCVLSGSVVATEALGLFALVIGFLTGGTLWAKYLHQVLVRRWCHGLRIAFRRSSSSIDSSSSCCRNPPRKWFCDMTPCEDEYHHRANPHLNGVKVVTVVRVRNPSESYH